MCQAAVGKVGIRAGAIPFPIRRKDAAAIAARTEYRSTDVGPRLPRA